MIICSSYGSDMLNPLYFRAVRSQNILYWNAVFRDKYKLLIEGENLQHFRQLWGTHSKLKTMSRRATRRKLYCVIAGIAVNSNQHLFRRTACCCRIRDRRIEEASFDSSTDELPTTNYRLFQRWACLWGGTCLRKIDSSRGWVHSRSAILTMRLL
jgi:hypothetical protein